MVLGMKMTLTTTINLTKSTPIFQQMRHTCFGRLLNVYHLWLLHISSAETIDAAVF